MYNTARKASGTDFAMGFMVFAAVAIILFGVSYLGGLLHLPG